MNTNQRLLTQPNSRLAKADIIARPLHPSYHDQKITTKIQKLLANGEAWSSLTPTQQKTLYSLLPPPSSFNPSSTTNTSTSITTTPATNPPPQQEREQEQLQQDTTIHPFKTPYAPYIKHFLHEWQSDLREGRNTQKWRNEAMLACGQRAAGMFDEVLAFEREEKWGSCDDGNGVGGGGGHGGVGGIRGEGEGKTTSERNEGLGREGKGDVDVENGAVAVVADGGAAENGGGGAEIRIEDALLMERDLLVRNRDRKQNADDGEDDIMRDGEADKHEGAPVDMANAGVGSETNGASR